MSMASVASDFAGPLALPQHPSDPVTLRNVSGPHGPVPGHWHFLNIQVTLRYVSGLSGLGLFQATGTFPTSQ